MAAASKKSAVTFVQCVRSALFFFQFASVKADGKLFALGPRNGSQSLDFAMAQQTCAALGAHLASPEELRKTIRDCSFAVCTTGWLADGTVGTTVCNKTGSKPQSVKVVDVQIEMDPSPSGRYNAICVKAEGKPCGDPPSFPHTILHGHTGFEMGDELHYICAQGYAMSNKDTAFTLLCHTCGEWFGQVQACVKDETEGYIDYEDNFPDDRSMPTEDQEHNIKETEEKGREPEKATDSGTRTHFADGDNHIGIKIMLNEQDTKIIYEGENFPIGPIIVNNDTKAAKRTESNADESWLDGYPVTQEAMEEEEDDDEGDKTDGSMGREDDIVTDQRDYDGIRKTGGSNLEKDLIQPGADSPLIYDGRIETILVTLLPTSGLGNESISKRPEDVIRYATMTPIGLVTQELASISTVTTLNQDVVDSSAVLHATDHIPLPEEEEIMTFPIQAVATVSSPNLFTTIAREALTYGRDGKLSTTFEPCMGGDCSSPDKGPIVAITVTVVCLLLLATVLAVWCFKKRQQKTSVYKLNGKEHARHQLQQIEMQKV
ncbi:sushi domain-containing protein 5 [Sceloporus undulatus]|uniref:sushi domain-containing protein 5 n=1 Tax=Sceloporus undulatus TaxID=8520 RepID=UPI001C4A9109|nr:sushi domain-containing protein 5 [Sceloporus undulatus]